MLKHKQQIIKRKLGGTTIDGFTLVELLVVVGIISILLGVVLVAVNPGRQFASARDAQRRGDLYSILNAIYQFSVENNGLIPTDITNTPTKMGTDPGLIDLSQELIPKFITGIPKDPTNGTDANTQYTVYRDANGRVAATASSEINPSIPLQVVR